MSTTEAGTHSSSESAARRARVVAALLFGSGMCALSYQVAWFRALRGIFGASTAATAAVLAVFVGGLGVGGLWLGPRADRSRQPLALYAKLEGGVALAAAASPGLIWIAERGYLETGGAAALGLPVATVLRLALGAVVLLPATLLMGGTLPAAARAVTSAGDAGRARLGTLYGWNTLGAVAGCVLTSFVLLEALGGRRTVWLAAAVNLAVAAVAWTLSRGSDVAADAPVTPGAAGTPAAPPRLVLVAAAVVGAAFFLMELVWYRMLGPLLGGSVFTFGLILATALVGIGAGGALYGRSARTPTMFGFGWGCLVQGLCFLVPYALGDRLAVLALLLRPLGGAGFASQVLGWSLVTVIVVLPGSIVAGYQFPMLIALLGRGREGVGRHTALAYAANTAGAIAGSLAGGFGLMPALSAPGCWRLVGVVMLALGAFAIASDARRARPSAWPFAAGTLTAAVLCLFALGPTAAFRHSQIGVGRVEPRYAASPLSLRQWQHEERRAVSWEQEGRESSVAIDSRHGIAFVVNGKVDGHVQADAATQIMGGLLGLLLHPDPKRALVIGLGTGSSAGWMGAVPSLTRLDVLELEPAILEVARRSAPVNQNVLQNPRVKITVGDAREAVLTSRERYDVVFSEPSNPYRAGIASLFTEEYYRVAAAHLADGGLFVQWVQAYEIDARTLRTIIATLSTVFPHVETWEARKDDVLLVASMHPQAHDVARLRRRIQEQPYKDALMVSWVTDEVEGVLAHHIARPGLARHLAGVSSERNTDDRTVIEFAFARGVGKDANVSADDLRKLARARNEHRPDVPGIDWDRADETMRDFSAWESSAVPSSLAPASRRSDAVLKWVEADLTGVRATWPSGEEPVGLVQTIAIAEALADAGDEASIPYEQWLRARGRQEAGAIAARRLFRRGEVDAAIAGLVASFEEHRTAPFASRAVLGRAVQLTYEVAGGDAARAKRLFDALAPPFSVLLLEEYRNQTRVSLARKVGTSEACVEALRPFETSPPWDDATLSFRVTCYERAGHALLRQAKDDLSDYRAMRPPTLE